MDKFIKFCVDTFIKEAHQFGNMSQLRQFLTAESDEGFIGKVSSIMDNLVAAFAAQGNNVLIQNELDVIKEIVSELKKKLCIDSQPKS